RTVMPAARRVRATLLTAAVAAATVAACASGGGAGPVAPSTTAPAVTPVRGSRSAGINPAGVHANELGLVPVLMYHQLVSHPVGDYEITPADFRAEMETLAADGYVPITARQLVTRRIDIPAGRHPVVLTFDDATVGQFRLGADGQPLGGTAV